MAAGLNRIHIDVPASFSGAQTQLDRDRAIQQLISAFSGAWDFYVYNDVNSGWGTWYYFAFGYSYVPAIGSATVMSVKCTGQLVPPTGTGQVTKADPGTGGLFSWTPMGYPWSLSAGSPSGGGISPPAGNNNYYVWNIPSNGSTTAADFTTAVTSIAAALAGPITSGTVVIRYLKYVDLVTGAWQVSAIFFGAGSTEWGTTNTVSVLATQNVLYAVMCSGTPSPPTGSPMPAVSIPAFTQTFVSLTGPLSFGPQR